MFVDHLRRRLGLLAAAWVMAGVASGCAGPGGPPPSGPGVSQSPPAGDEVGRTYYIDGAGNWGYGVREVAAGLRKAGYRGRVINWRWSPTLNPALDQTVGRPFARARGKALGEEINAYARQYPEGEVNIIALSAGTGVAAWACEAVVPPARVHCLILLGSSLSADYDLRAALDNIHRGIWVYYSGHDAILLGPVRALGTIDGKLGADGAGLVGLRPRNVQTDKIHNVAWASGYRRLGWTGSHTDATSEPFVHQVLARHIVAASMDEAGTATASVSAAQSQDAWASLPGQTVADRSPPTLLASQ